MRCFIGIHLPEVIKDYIYEIQKEIGHENAKIKWIAKKNLHITIKFLGNLDEEKLKVTREVLGDVKFKKFKLELGELGYFSSYNKIRVIWVDLKPPYPLLNLHGEVELKLGNLFKKEEKYAVHLTLGRIKLIKDKDKFIGSLNSIKIKLGSFDVDEFYLIRSILSKDGPTYTVLEKYDLE